MFGLGSTEILIIAVVILVLFGASAIPKFAKSIGKAKSEFEKGVKEGIASGETGDQEPKKAAPKKGT